MYRGACHCGAISVELELSKPAAETRLRACQCSFCRPRGTRTVGDPSGRAVLRAASPDQLTRYRFGHRTADYLLCRTCGTYVAAVLETGGRRISVVNVAGLGVDAFRDRAADPVNYDGESEADRVTRRQANWMPIEFDWACV
jgi:hypothetical protein